MCAGCKSKSHPQPGAGCIAWAQPCTTSYQPQNQAINHCYWPQLITIVITVTINHYDYNGYIILTEIIVLLVINHHYWSQQCRPFATKSHHVQGNRVLSWSALVTNQTCTSGSATVTNLPIPSELTHNFQACFFSTTGTSASQRISSQADLQQEPPGKDYHQHQQHHTCPSAPAGCWLSHLPWFARTSPWSWATSRSLDFNTASVVSGAEQMTRTYLSREMIPREALSRVSNDLNNHTQSSRSRERI